MSAGGELFRHHRVHGDHDLLLLSHQGVALLDLFRDPILEVRADHASADVDDPLLRHLLEVRHVGQVEVDFRLGAGELQDFLQG